MFEKIIITLVLILSAVLVFSGCQKLDQVEDQIENKVEAVEDSIEDKIDAVEDAVENAVEDAVFGTQATDAVYDDGATPGDVAESDVPVSTPDLVQNSLDRIQSAVEGALREEASAQSGADVPSADAQADSITPEDAKAIALQHAEVDAADAVFDRVEHDFDRGVYHYEIEFRVGLVEYDYDIDAATGEILSFERD